MVFGEKLVMFVNQGGDRNFEVSGISSSRRAQNQASMVCSDFIHQGDSNNN